ncbi:hypothetical protein GDO81_014053 [Engystomops pustulosus]|uniref:Uncharacterized protein n=1 Tax=Engystomops pustulosus TaxID=76066 RepID=A0AAV7B7J2_ENGPU|nr:hypothetical protein GDO81_014053 [Engystomops pustulosus]
MCYFYELLGKYGVSSKKSAGGLWKWQCQTLKCTFHSSASASQRPERSQKQRIVTSELNTHTASVSDHWKQLAWGVARRTHVLRFYFIFYTHFYKL